jgi:hypothetical protein
MCVMAVCGNGVLSAGRYSTYLLAICIADISLLLCTFAKGVFVLKDGCITMLDGSVYLSLVIENVNDCHIEFLDYISTDECWHDIR